MNNNNNNSNNNNDLIINFIHYRIQKSYPHVYPGTVYI